MNWYHNWLLASRPWSFAMTAISVSVGGCMAAIDGSFSWGLYLITLTGTVLLHAATNLINDYYDVGSGVDFRNVPTSLYRPHPLLEGKLRPVAVRNVAATLYALAAGAGLLLAALRGWELCWLILVGGFASLAYTAPPFKYKYVALGELSVFLMWGPFMVSGAYFVQRQTFSHEALLVSMPFGTLVALVLLANNLRDIQHDRSKGIKTLALSIGAQRSWQLYAGLVVLAYIAVAAMSLFGPLPVWSLLVLASLPLALSLLKQMSRQPPIDADARTAKLDTAFGVLLVISLILEELF
jgi:1,4-dihydroxy-2-naphthoate octaprenyltransferase